MSELSPNLYLLSEHEPVSQELDVTDLKVEGAIPPELRGMFVRNSPNPQFAPEGRYHWFDGDGMVHGVRFGDGKAGYVNKWIRTDGFKKEREAGKPLWTGIMEPVKKNGLKDTANTDLVVHNGRLFALWWLSGTPHELSVKDLSTIGTENFGGKLTGGFAAHPKVDPRSGELVFFDYSIIRPPFLRYGVVSKSGELVKYEPIEVPIPHIQHDIALSENYTILLDLPLGWDPVALKNGKRKIGFDRETPSRFGIIPRHGGNADIKWFTASSCYIYHTINAYERGDEVVLEGCRVADPIPKQQETSGRVARLDFIELVPHLFRWTFNMKTGAVKEEQLDDATAEFPRVNESRRGRQLQYSYNVRVAPRPDLMFDGFIKYDLKNGLSESVDFEKGWFGNEVTFAEKPNAKAEDDGWLVTVLSHAKEKRSKALVYEAAAPGEGPIATVELPQRVPIGFHTCWVPAT